MKENLNLRKNEQNVKSIISNKYRFNIPKSAYTKNRNSLIQNNYINNNSYISNKTDNLNIFKESFNDSLNSKNFISQSQNNSKNNSFLYNKQNYIQSQSRPVTNQVTKRNNNSLRNSIVDEKLKIDKTVEKLKLFTSIAIDQEDEIDFMNDHHTQNRYDQLDIKLNTHKGDSKTNHNKIDYVQEELDNKKLEILLSDNYDLLDKDYRRNNKKIMNNLIDKSDSNKFNNQNKINSFEKTDIESNRNKDSKNIQTKRKNEILEDYSLKNQTKLKYENNKFNKFDSKFKENTIIRNSFDHKNKSKTIDDNFLNKNLPINETNISKHLINNNSICNFETEEYIDYNDDSCIETKKVNLIDYCNKTYNNNTYNNDNLDLNKNKTMYYNSLNKSSIIYNNNNNDREIYDINFNRIINGYKIINNIGSGSFGTVYKAKQLSTDKFYALKIYDKTIIKQEQMEEKLKCIYREKEILSKISNKNIIKYIDYIDKDNEIVLVLEYFEGLQLNEYFIKNKPGKTQCLDIFHQIIKTIHYLHDNNVTHRDLKPQNILINSHRQIKLIDFGFSICVSATSMVKLFCGSLKFLAPEVMQGLPHLSTPVDIYSLGVTLFKLINNEYPTEFDENQRLNYKVINRNAEYKEIEDLILRMIEFDPTKRPSIKEILFNNIFL